MVSGCGLRPYVSAKGLEQLRERLSGRDLAIIGQVADLRLMSARQIEAVHFPASEHDSQPAAARARQRVLGRLVRDRLLIRLERRIGGVRAGSAGFVFAVGPVGYRLLAAGGRGGGFRSRPVAFSITRLHSAARRGRGVASQRWSAGHPGLPGRAALSP